MDEETDDKRRLEQKRYARSLEINAFSKIVSALRASRKYTKKLDKNIKIVAQSLRIPDHVRRNEIRRAANDNYLSSIANCIHNENTDSEWLLASSRCVPNQPLIAPHTIFTQLANSISSILLEMNKTLPDPLPPSDDAVPSVRKCDKTDLQNVGSLNTTDLSKVFTEKTIGSDNINKCKSQEKVNSDESCFDSSTTTKMDLILEKYNDSNIRFNEESDCKIIDNELNAFNKSNDQYMVHSDHRTQHTIQIPNNTDELQPSFRPVNSKFIDAVTNLENEPKDDEKISDNDLLQKNFSKNLEFSVVAVRNSNNKLKKNLDCDSNCENTYNVGSLSNCIKEKPDDMEKITSFTANTNNIKSSSDTIDSVRIANTNLPSYKADSVQLSELSQLKKEKNEMFFDDNKSGSAHMSELITDNKLRIASVDTDTELKPFDEFNVLENDIIQNAEHCLEQCINKTGNTDICTESTACNTDIKVTDAIFSSIIDNERNLISCDKSIISVDENLLSPSASQISSVCSSSNLCNVNSKKRKLPITAINEINCKLPRYKTNESKSTDVDSPQFLINQSKLSDKFTEGEIMQEECSNLNSASSVVYMHHDYVKMSNYCPADSSEKT